VSIEIKDLSSSCGPHALEDLNPYWVNLMARHGSQQVTATMPRADFLAAVETECGVRISETPIPLAEWELELLGRRIVPADAIVIDRAELPEVTPSGGCSGAGTQYLSAAGHEIADTSDAARVHVYALALLALAEYLDARQPTPPVNEADVEALAGLIEQCGQTCESWESNARRLLATGRVSVTHE